MYMTDGEIRKIWRNGVLPAKKMIQCLADLNGCHYDEAKTRCESLGLVTPGQYKARSNRKHPKNERARWTQTDVSQLIQMRKDGIRVPEIAKKLGRSEISVKLKIYKMIKSGNIFEY